MKEQKLCKVKKNMCTLNFWPTVSVIFLSFLSLIGALTCLDVHVLSPVTQIVCSDKGDLIRRNVFFFLNSVINIHYICLRHPMSLKSFQCTTQCQLINIGSKCILNFWLNIPSLSARNKHNYNFFLPGVGLRLTCARF